MSKITYIDEVEITNKRILLRVDFNVSLSADKTTIIDDTRIKETIPTLNFLLKNNNKLILIAHLGRPKTRDPQLSLKIVAERLQTYLQTYKVVLIEDFLSYFTKALQDSPKNKTVFLLENIRFYPEEKSRNNNFIDKLAALGDIYVNDAFGVCHRETSSVVDLPKKLPAYGGLLLKKEIETLTPILSNPKKPFVTVIGGAKISTKISLIEKLGQLSDKLIIGGALANTFLAAFGQNIGESFYEKNQLENAKFLKNKLGNKLVLPIDTVFVENKILDIGQKSQKLFQEIITRAKTIVWNGPVGFFEDPRFTAGSQAVLDAITQNTDAYSIVGGGDTLAFIKGKANIDKISHISTGGGAMLQFFEKGTLPGIEALKK